MLPQAYQAEAVASHDGRRFYLREHDFYGNIPQNRYDGRDLAVHVYDLVNDRDIFYAPLPKEQRTFAYRVVGLHGGRVITMSYDAPVMSFDPTNSQDATPPFDLRTVAGEKHRRN